MSAPNRTLATGADAQRGVHGCGTRQPVAASSPPAFRADSTTIAEANPAQKATPCEKGRPLTELPGRGAGWVEADRLAGSRHRRVVLLVLLPSIRPAMMVPVSLNLGWALLIAAALSLLGIGVQPRAPDLWLPVAAVPRVGPSRTR